MSAKNEDRPGLELLKLYLSSGYGKTEGWCNSNVIRLTSALSNIQEKHHIEGGAGEIGVHHGKYFIALALLKYGKKSVAFDVFSSQNLNVDRSGRGDLEVFTSNLTEYGCLDFTTIVKQDSLRLNSARLHEINNMVGPLSMFSVDGSHTVEHTYNDILVAESLLGAGGLMFIDDYLNPNWPGVLEAVGRYFSYHSYKFVPLCFAFSKLVLVDYSYYDVMIKELGSIVRSVSGWSVKSVKRFGYSNYSIISAS